MKGNFFKKCVSFVRSKNNNKGSSIILVIVSIAFVSMLVAISAHMSYYNFAMRDTDRSSKANFYTAEEAMGEIKLGLEADVSSAMAIAYTAALEQNTSVELDNRAQVFEDRYREELIKAVRVAEDDGAGGFVYDNSKYNLDKIKSYLVKTAYNATTGVGAQIITDSASGENVIFLKGDGGISLQNICLMYTDQRGYVSIIKTDIWLRNPQISLAKSQGVPDLENCAIIANGSLELNANNLEIAGNIYGGNSGTLIQNTATVKLVKRDTDSASTMYKFIADHVKVKNTLETSYALDMSDNYQLYAKDIEVDSGKISLGGESFVQDDLMIDGKDSSIRLSGDYYGYGDQAYQAKDSSSILVNGANTVLDLSSVRSLMLSGHAYIAARHYDANLTTDDYVEDPDAVEEPDPAAPAPTYSKNERDVLMGESIGVKANQLMYLVPRECMGYYHNSNVEQYIAKNPLSYAEYQTLTSTYQVELNADGTEKKDAAGNPVYVLDSQGNKILKYDVVNTNIIMDKTGKSLMNLGASYIPVFRKVNGTVLVYYYLRFESEQFANEFFKSYYETNKDELTEYVKAYIRDIKINSGLVSSAAESTLRLAGNAVTFDADDNVVLMESTNEIDEASAETLATNRSRWADAFKAYRSKMLSSTDLINETLEPDWQIFNNLVDVTKQATLGLPSGTLNKFYVGDDVYAIFLNCEGSSTPFELNQYNVDDSVSLIIVKGDAKFVKHDFHGLIMCSGKLTIDGACEKIECAPASVRKAMLSVYNKLVDEDKEFYRLFKDGASYAGSAGSQEESSGSATAVEEAIERKESAVQVGDQIVFENWTKK